MSQRDIAATIEDICGQMSSRTISTITGCVMEGRGMAESSSAPVVLSICFRRLHLRIAAHGYGVQQVAVYVMPRCSVNGCKDVASLWINETESKHAWMQIFDELRARGVKDLGIICPWMA